MNPQYGLQKGDKWKLFSALSILHHVFIPQPCQIIHYKYLLLVHLYSSIKLLVKFRNQDGTEFPLREVTQQRSFEAAITFLRLLGIFWLSWWQQPTDSSSSQAHAWHYHRTSCDMTEIPQLQPATLPAELESSSMKRYLTLAHTDTHKPLLSLSSFQSSPSSPSLPVPHGIHYPGSQCPLQSGELPELLPVRGF